MCFAVFLGLKGAVGQSFSFLILFVTPMAPISLYLFFNMPETKNRNHKEVGFSLKKVLFFDKNSLNFVNSVFTSVKWQKIL